LPPLIPPLDAPRDPPAGDDELGLLLPPLLPLLPPLLLLLPLPPMPPPDAPREPPAGEDDEGDEELLRPLPEVPRPFELVDALPPAAMGVLLEQNAKNPPRWRAGGSIGSVAGC
jgi:hypothetical protein